MTDPALDDDKAEAAIANALIEVGGEDEGRWAYETLAALNEQGVVLCDEHALAELRQQVKGVGPGGIVHRCPGESGLMPCCDRFPFEVSAWDRLSLTGQTVTCTGRAQ